MRRLRRLRQTKNIRDLVAQTQLDVSDFILPYFLVEGKGVSEEISSMPGVSHFSIDEMLKDLEGVLKNGIRAVLLFGVSPYKSDKGDYAYSKDNIVSKAIRNIKRRFPEVVVISDICLCGYTVSGHCGIVKQKKMRKWIDNDETIKILAKIALSYAQAGSDFVAPSSMMDGQVEVIRRVLDDNGLDNVGILAYSVKYASSFYAPFREALDSAPQFGDRKTYQMDYRNSDEALREVEEDLKEGADIVMVKPALAYLDIITRVKEKFNVPVAAYSVSGEYVMLKALGRHPVSLKDLVLETMCSIKRAGADLIITYFSRDIGEWLNES